MVVMVEVVRWRYVWLEEPSAAWPSAASPSAASPSAASPSASRRQLSVFPRHGLSYLRGRPYFYNARLRWVDGWVGDVGVGVVRLGHQPVRPSGTERALLMMGPAEVGALLGAIPPHPAAPSRAPPLLASWLAAAAAAAAAAYSRNYQLL
ncbi:hypothetical protein VOLCADRAFT_90556 [Volvox carteri f. nagariensis]|uniref:Uncharacterized protein n=1 Tax=Volvox carteri f. nagariensis TaxID=3068 RepID=D8TUQ3_VOLCA|nr:uncharacterized protein VOLCADRAFT_90556 [Volvox carteri f. nagariensis]EFJ48747.1 hypothetical protein VOLCADRAFT_90556 [Volvox carteri f. nagariensis]|eukprot:XP_002950079.1 hypothetical protein VOLCADRAFT_90556 [Volvox carteri f. nagariensis]